MQPAKTVTFDGREIGNGYPVFIVLEAGPTHDGLQTAKQLVRHAAEAGADAVKFQLLDPNRLVSDRTQLLNYDILVDKETGETKTVSEPLYSILQRRCLSREEWVELKRYCDELGIIFFSTATFFDEVDFLTELGCETIKICSGDIDYLQLIEYSAQKDFCLQLDTGNATIGDVERAVDVALDAGNNKIIVHNCPSGYPAKLESINLRLIPTLKTMFQCPVAFSDHSPGWEMDIAAVALGANVVEKTISLDRCTPSVEHMFSLEPDEVMGFVRSIRDLEVALGNPRRVMDREERKRAMAVRRSAVLVRDVRGGDLVEPDAIDFARPGFGIKPDMAPYLLGKRFRRDLKRGHLLAFEDVDYEMISSVCRAQIS